MNRLLLALCLALAVVIVTIPVVPSVAKSPPHQEVTTTAWVVIEREALRPAASTGTHGQLERVAVGPDESVVDALQRIARVPGVRRAALEKRFIEMGAPNDPRFGEQWNMSAIGIESAWQDTTGSGSIVAVIDSGLSIGGVDTPCNGIVSPYNAITQTEGIDAVVDRSGHGTHVAGTVAQCTDNGIGVTGVAHGAAVMPIKVLDSVEGGGTTTEMALAIEWATNHGANVINISLGSPDCGDTFDAVLSPRFQAAVDAGIAIIASSGNSATPGCVRYPASDSLTIAVGASTLNSTVASYSERGPHLTLVAPGGEVSGGQILQETINGSSYEFQEWVGTSMAAPHVAGVAALLKALDPSLDSESISALLTSTATDIGPAGWDEESGAGIVNASAAVAAAVTRPLPMTIVGGTAAVSTSQETELAAAHFVETLRLAGSNRYATAAAVSVHAYPAGAKTAFVVTGENFADALGVGPAAVATDSPILLTRSSTLPDPTRTELQRLNPDEIIIVGGTAAVSSSVEASLGSIAPTTRIAGSNRYQTATALSRQIFSSSEHAYVVNGDAFADGLAGGPLAGTDGAPILLVRSTSLPAETRAEIVKLGVTEVHIIGGTAVVSGDVETALLQIVPSVDRIAGSNRYATAAEVSNRFPDPLGVTIASGLTYPDALAVAPLSGMTASPILLVGTGPVPSPTHSAIADIAGR